MSRTLAATLDAIAGVEGWLSEDQAERMFAAAAAVPDRGTIVEIGSFRGRSTIVLASAAPPSVTVVAIDPHAGGDRGPREIAEERDRGEADRRAFEANLAGAGVAERIRHVRLRSSEAGGEVTAPIDMLYIDGAHRFTPARQDIAQWGARVRPGGTLLIHDAFSSIGVTLALLVQLAFGREFAYVSRSRSLAEYRRLARPLAGRGRTRNAARQLAELPWFARNVAIKAALVARRPRLAGLLGNDPRDGWPY